MRLKKSIILLIILSLFFSACLKQAPLPTPTAAPAATSASSPIAPPAQPATAAPSATPTQAPLPTASWQNPKSEGWWKEAVFYEAFVRSFYDSNGDGIGDFKGLTAKLDYLNTGKPGDPSTLGVNGIWLMPIFPSPSYHGYDVTDYYSVNPQYGTLDDFKAFLAAAHQRGIRVVIDFVINHTSDQHPWFKASAAGDPKYKDWYIWSNTDPGYNGPWNEQVWHPLNGKYYYGIFTPQMPDLNLRNPEVTAEIDKIASFWLKDVSVDGLRLDAAKHLVEEVQIQADTASTHAWLKEFHKYVKSIRPDALIVGEVQSPTPDVAAYTTDDELDLAFNFDLAKAILNGVTGQNGGMVLLSEASSAYYFKNSLYAPILSNHDFPRVMTVLGDNMPAAKVAATILLTAPGAPFIYYGEEIGMQGNKPDETIRTPMQWDDSTTGGFTTGQPWEALQPDFKTKNVKAQDTDPASLLNHYRQLIHIRSEHVALRAGDYVKVKSSDPKLFALLRNSPEESVLILINLGSEPVKGPGMYWEKSTLSGTYQPTLLLGSGKVAPLTVTATGGTDNYQPLPEIPGYGQIMIQFR